MRLAHLFGWTLAEIDRLSVADVGDCMGYWQAQSQLEHHNRTYQHQWEGDSL